MSTPDSSNQEIPALPTVDTGVAPLEPNADAVKVVLAYGNIEDPVDRKLVIEAATFLASPTGALPDIVSHATNMGEVIGGYMMQGKDVPLEVDALHGQLLTLLCQHHIDAVKRELSQASPDLLKAEHSMRLALDAGKVLAKGYNDAIWIAEIETSRLQIDQMS
jgi:hypothetical protein